MPTITIRTNPKLKRMYNRYNKQYFGGRLPKKVIIGFRRRSGELMAQCHLELRWIWIASNLRPWAKVVEHALLHEMSHFSTDLAGAKAKEGDGGMHGEKWQAEMLRLAGLGAFRELW